MTLRTRMSKNVLAILLISIIQIACNKKSETIESNEIVLTTEDKLKIILNEQKNKLDSIDNKYNINNNKEILNHLFANDNFILNKNNSEILTKIDSAEKYFDNIYSQNNLIFEETSSKLKDLKNSQTKLNNKTLNEIEMGILNLTLLNGSLLSYNLNMKELTSNMKKVIDLKTNCKNKITNNQILFEDQNCLNKFNKIISEIQRLQIEGNKIKEKINKL